MSAVGDSNGSDARLRRYGLLSLGAVVYTYLLVVYGGVVRITGSGMGCGDDWPDCNGALVPAFDVATFIEYTHRLLGGGLALLTLALLVGAWRRRRRPGWGGPGGVMRPAVLAAVLVVIQALLGALTVKLELPAGVTAVHFMMALVLLAIFQVMAVRAGAVRSGPGAAPGVGGALTAAGLGLLVVLFGALTANMGMQGPFPPSGAAMACQGFPLCNGELLPAGNAWIHIHWTHRMTAFVLFFHVLGTLIAWRGRPVPTGVRRAAVASLVLIAVQLAVAAALVLLTLPKWLQGMHLAVGTAVWSALVFWAILARSAAARSPGRGSATVPPPPLDPHRDPL